MAINATLYKRRLDKANFVTAFTFFLFLQKSFTSTRLFLLFLDAGSDGVVLLVNALASSDLAENLTGLLAPALLEKPAGALRQEEEEADELQHCRDNGQTQHVPAVWRERGGEKRGRNAERDLPPLTLKLGSEDSQGSWRALQGS